jgi:anthranilate/para-aminobenzoate synthase component I
VRYHVGGGIVIASEAEAEWQETCDKARELDRALGLD